MRFGMFVPQGWRLDLAGIDPADHWKTMLGLAKTRGGRALRIDLGLRPLPHRARPDRGGHARGVVADLGVRRRDGAVRLGQMCTCMGYRNPAYLAKVAATADVDLRRPGRDGHRRRLVRARVARLRLRLPGRRRAARPARRGRADHAELWTTGKSTLDGKHYQDRRRDLPSAAARRKAASRCGSPAAARRRRSGSPRSTRSTRTSPATPRRLPPASRRSSRSTARRSAPTSTRSSARPTTTSSSARPRRTSRTSWPGCRPTSRSTRRRRRRALDRDFVNGPLVGTPEQVAEKLAATAGGSACRYAIFNFPEAAYDRSGIDLFTEKVAPALA